MDFALTPDQQSICDMARDFGSDQIASNALAWEAQGTIARELLSPMGELGFGGIHVSDDHSGSGLKRLDATLILEALSMARRAVAAFESIQHMCAWMIDTFGSTALREHSLPHLSSPGRHDQQS